MQKAAFTVITRGVLCTEQSHSWRVSSANISKSRTGEEPNTSPL